MKEAEARVIDLEIIADDMKGRSKPELRLWLRMLSTTRLVSQEIRRRLRREFDMTLPQFDIMAQLYRETEGLRLGELSKRTMVTNGNITGLVERLEKDGLLTRFTPDDDRRVTMARLRPEGEKLFARMASAHEGWLCDMMEEVEPATLASMWNEIGLVKSSIANHLSGEGD